MDHWNIEDYEPNSRTPALQVIKNQLIRGEIITKYALIDEYLTVIICRYFFRKPKQRQTFRQLWRTKRFKVFNHHMMDEIYLLPKIRIVHAIAEVPTEVRGNVERINALRNDIAHSFFPENRKAHMPNKKRLYRGLDIFTKAGVDKFLEDFRVVSNYLGRRAFGLVPE